MSSALHPVPESAGEEGYDWTRMHPVTPALQGWKVLLGVLTIVSFQLADEVAATADRIGAQRTGLVVLGGLLLVGLVGFAYSALAWRVARFAVTDEAVHLRKGLLFRQQRQARLDRLQAVDVVRPLLARLLGLAQLNLEVAGGEGSSVQLAFLREADATRLRAQILALAAGLRPGAPSAPQARPATAAGPSAAPLAVTLPAPGDGPATAGPAPEAPDAPDAPAPAAFEAAPEQQVYELPVGRLVGSLVRSASGWVAVAGLVVALVVAGLSGDLAAMFIALPGAIGSLGYWWNQVNGGAMFRAAASPDGIRLRHGLTETRTQTVPPGRVQAVRISQTLLWRRKDWWRVDINVAGYRAQDQTGTVLHPVATREEAALALWLVLPDLGVEDPLATLDAALTGAGTDGGFTAAPRRARWVDPVSWHRHGVLVTRTALLLRSGRWRRTVVVVPHERTQSLGLVQGPLQRRLQVATFTVHSTPGPVSPQVQHLDEHVAADLLDEQAARAREARAVAGPELWMRATAAGLVTGDRADGGPADSVAPGPWTDGGPADADDPAATPEPSTDAGPADHVAPEPSTGGER